MSILPLLSGASISEIEQEQADQEDPRGEHGHSDTSAYPPINKTQDAAAFLFLGAFTPNARELFLHHVPAEGSAAGFYERFGFEHTGREAHGELEMRLRL